MSNVILRRAIRHALITATAASIVPAAVLAQDTTTKTLERIQVTGTNIRRADMETASPVQAITREEIERTGKATVAEYLQTLTSDGAGSIPKTFGNGFAGGGAGVSLRGLGAGSTLVLLNGRRMAPFGLADDGQKVFTDLSTIPMEAVERIEILKDGASAIYGSDAIAGVVNIILRRDFTGVVLKGSYGMSGDSDGNAMKASITAGTGDLATDDFNAFFNLEVSDTDEIFVSDRSNRKWIGNGDLRPYGYSINGSQFLVGSITPGVVDPDTGVLGAGNATSSPTGSIRGTDGQYVSLPGCSQFSSVSPQDPNGGCLWQAGQFRSLTPKERYVNFFTRGTFALSENAEIYAEFGYSKKKTTFHNTPSGVSGAWGFPGGPVNASSGAGAVILAADHPDNILGVDARLRYSAFDVGPRITYNTNEFTRLLAGIKGTAGAWDYDVGYLHSQTSLVNERTGFLRYSVVRSVLTDPNNPYGWWRLGANAYLNSPELYAAISPRISATASTSLDLFDAKASRELVDLPGGPLGLALGAEYRRQTASLTPLTYTDTGDIIGLGYSAYDGTQEVMAAYLEMLAPLHRTLELSGAVRVDKYKDGDTSTTPKFGVKWTPIPQVALRATYAEGFRAPNPAENGKGGLAAFTNVRDPVRCPGGTPAPGATDADCNAAVAVITTPNPNLKPEKSKNYTFGLVLQPFDSTTMTVDWWQIKRTDEINQETTTQAIAKGNVVRSDNLLNGQAGTGTLLAALASYVNSNTTTVRGIDLDIRQRFNLSDYGQLNLDLQWTRINSFEREEMDGTTFQFAGTHGNCDVTNCIGTPKDRINFGATWDINAWSVSGVVNYRGKFDNVAFEGDVCANSFANGADAPSHCEIASFYTFDLSGRWKATDALEVFGSVQNLFDRIAPLDPLTYGAVNYNPLDSSGAIGRYFTLGARYTFN